MGYNYRVKCDIQYAYIEQSDITLVIAARRMYYVGSRYWL